MRKLLKYGRPNITKYMRLQKQSGIFPKRFDQECYDILTKMPPMVDPPKPFYNSLKEFDIKLPTDKYVRAYMRRHALKRDADHERTMVDLLGEYTANTLKRGERFNKALGPAYDFALRQVQMLTEHPDMTEDESVDKVEALLAEENKKERFEAKKRRMEILRKSKEVGEDGSRPAAFFGNEQTALKMAEFGDYLQRVPYYRWTVGAATALDHWIAIEILSLSEKTWQDILQGEAFSQASDVIAVRSALFPETLEAPDDLNEAGSIDDVDEERPGSEEEDHDAAIDELLASLGRSGDDMWKDEDEKTLKDDGYEVDEDEILQAKLKVMEEEIMIWQKKNLHTPFKHWADDDKNEFDTWLVDYGSTLSSQPGTKLDISKLRKKVLYDIRIPKDDAEELWNGLADETEAEIILNQLRENFAKNPPMPREGEDDEERLQREEFTTFMQLPFEDQLVQLREIGSLRPMYDESVSDEDRTKFYDDNEEVLLEDVVETNVVPDREGEITDNHLGLPVKGVRYKLQKLMHGQYGSEESGSAQVIAQERALYQAWGEYKRMKANHEEYLFREGKLGLEYENPEDAHKPSKPPKKEEGYFRSKPWKKE